MSNIEFNPPKPIFCFSSVSTSEDTNLIIVPSGYLGQFHVIVEHGDSSMWNNYFLDKTQIFKRWGVEVPDISLGKLVREQANDMTLGGIIRKLL
jgi:hypothetical protein